MPEMQHIAEQEKLYLDRQKSFLETHAKLLHAPLQPEDLSAYYDDLTKYSIASLKLTVKLYHIIKSSSCEKGSASCKRMLKTILAQDVALPAKVMEFVQKVETERLRLNLKQKRSLLLLKIAGQQPLQKRSLY